MYNYITIHDVKKNLLYEPPFYLAMALMFWTAQKGLVPRHQTWKPIT